MDISPLDLPETGFVTVSGAPEGYDALVVAAEARKRPTRDILLVARDDVRAQAFRDAFAFFAPDIEGCSLSGLGLFAL